MTDEEAEGQYEEINEVTAPKVVVKNNLTRQAVVYMLTGMVNLNLMSTFVKVVGLHTDGAVSAWQTGLSRSVGICTVSFLVCKY